MALLKSSNFAAFWNKPERNNNFNFYFYENINGADYRGCKACEKLKSPEK